VPVRPALNLRIADRLLEDGIVSEADHERAVEYARSRNMRIEEALLELGILNEAELLQFVSRLHETQFVSTERMSRAKVDAAALRLVPKKLAELYGLYPLLHEAAPNRLIVATADPDNLSAFDEVKVAARVRDVRALAARPAAVAAAIARGYDGEKFAFTDLLRGAVRAGELQLADPFADERPHEPRPAQRRAEPAPPRAAERSEPRPAPARPERPAPARPERAEPPAKPAPAPRPARPEPAAPPARAERIERAEPRAAAAAPPEPPPRRPVVPERPAVAARRSLDPPPAPPPPVRPPPPRDAGRYTDAAAPAPRGGARSPEPKPPEPALDDDVPEELRAATHLAADAGSSSAPEEAEAPSTEPTPGAHATPTRVAGTPLAAVRLVRKAAAAPRGAAVEVPTSRLGAFGGEAKTGALFGEETKSSEAPPSEPFEAAPLSKRSLPPPPSRLNLGPRSRRSSDRPPSVQVPALGGQIVEVLRVLVGLLENERQELRGHSSLVARLVQDACERIHLSESNTAALVMAAYLHDLGKRAAPSSGRRREPASPAAALHLTALNVSQFAPHRELAHKLVELPEQLVAAAGLPEQTLQTLRSMYEQMGGKGLPSGLSGTDIPIGARVLAVADSYADLTQNPRNTYDRLLSPEEAMAELRRHAGVVFDANIVDVFEHGMTGEKILTQLLDESHRVLIVDPDPEQTLVLQLRLTDQGFEVHLARNTKEARSALAANKFGLVVSEIDLEERDAGLFLREEVAKGEQGKHIPWVFLSARSSRNTAKRAFDLGVDDFISKPTSADIVVAKITQLVERLADRKTETKAADPRGVSGSLSDMGLTDLVQIFWHGRRTCSLHIEAGDTKGEVHFLEGQLVHVIWGDASGEKAFYRMLAQSNDGRFRVDPSFVPSAEPTIARSPEGLLLEGMRLIDENIVP